MPDLGDGVGLRDPHFAHLMRTDPAAWGVDWFEILSENFLDHRGYAAHVLERVAAHRPVVMHGVSLSIGSADPLDLDYLGKLAELAERVKPAWISDHLCWTGSPASTRHDLLPMPLTEASLAHVTARVRAVQDRLGRPLILENPSTYLSSPARRCRNGSISRRLAEDADCGLLLDVNNVYMSARSTTASTRPPTSRRCRPSGSSSSISPAHATAAPICSTPTTARCSAPVWELYRAGAALHRRRLHPARMGCEHSAL